MSEVRRAAAPRRVEVLLATAVLLLGAGEVWVPFSSRQGAGSALASTIGVALVALTLLWTRRHPLVPVAAVPLVWGVVALAAPTYVLFYGQAVPLEIGVFMAARYGRGRTPLWAAGVAAATLLLVDLSVPLLQEPGEIAFHWVVTALVWSAGFGLRTYDRRARESTRRAVRAEVDAAEQAMQAVLEERTRIARELHDIVAHAVSSVVVQAGAAEQAEDDPEFVRRALASIRATGNEALGDMRRLVGMLRTADEAPLSPQPRLESLPDLVARSSEAGPATVLSVKGDVRPLPTGVDLAVFRIVQEALTNVRKHSGASRCEVSIDYEPESVSVRIVDDGRGPRQGTDAAGHGLVGMRERAELYGGTLEAGPASQGGFAVRLVVPVAP